MHARILSVAVFLAELSTVASGLGSYCSLANKIPVDTRMHFLYSMFSALVHGQSVTRSTYRICIQVARCVNFEFEVRAPSLIYM